MHSIHLVYERFIDLAATTITEKAEELLQAPLNLDT